MHSAWPAGTSTSGAVDNHDRVYLATTPSDRIDSEAIDNERLFTYRFGIDAPKSVREQLLKLKNDHGLTDREIRWLRRSGQLKISRAIAELKPDRVLPAVGWFYAIQVAVFCGCMAVLIIASPADAWKQVAGLSGLLGFWAIATWFSKQLLIAPWHWVRHVARTRVQSVSVGTCPSKSQKPSCQDGVTVTSY
jgi:hypothetical protein